MVYHFSMKTTIELPDALYREIKARAALNGQTVKSYITESLRRSLGHEERRPEERGWRAAFGKVPRAAVREVQASIDTDLSRIDPDEWR